MAGRMSRLTETSVSTQWLWVKLSLCLTLTPSLGEAQPQLTPDQVIARFAAEQMQRLQSSGAMVKRAVIARYFAAYPLPPKDAEAQRLLGTQQRIINGFAGKLYSTAQQLARDTGSSSVTLADVTASTKQLLPSASTSHKTRIFFPEAAPEQQLQVELIDLEAFQDTPLPWGALGSLTLPPEGLPFRDDDSVRRFAETASAYGLLVFRLAAIYAREEFAPWIMSPHLRDAQKAVARRAIPQEAPGATPSPPPPLSASATASVQTSFTDVSDSSGIRFRHVSSDWISRFRRYGPITPTFSGGGVTSGDLDGDGWDDLLYCGGEGCAAFRNRQQGSFEDITLESKLGIAGEARMSLIADFDNDADRDVFITYARDSNRYLRNRGNGRFDDVTHDSGLLREGDISGPAIALDYDNDGQLDIYVGNFGNYLAGASPWYLPDPQNAQPNRLYRNLGESRFEDVTDIAGAVNTGWTQAVSHVDYDRDGDQDIYIANDFGSNEFLENQGDGTFQAIADRNGTIDPYDGMNVAFADLNRDSHADILISNIWGWVPTSQEPIEFNTLLVSTLQAEDALRYERDLSLIPDMIDHDTGWSWAALFFDADNDGDDDLFLANGLTDYSTARQDRPHPNRPGALYPISHNRERNVFFRNDDGLLEIPSQPSGAELGDSNSRSLSLLDYDHDGDLDLAISVFHSQARLFRNDFASGMNHWLHVELVGDPELGTNREAIGAQLTARDASDLYVWRTVTGGEGYLGMSTLPVEIGAGAATAVDLEILWPGMKLQRFEGVAVNQAIRIHEGNPVFRKLYGD